MCGRCSGWDDPCTLLRRAVCHSSISKDVEGEFGNPTSESRVCREQECVTLTTDQQLTLKLGTHAECDRVPELDGVIEVRDLVHVFDTDGNGRGLHSGDLRWESAVGLILGRLSGITNAGTHRAPAFQACQRCRDAVMEGQLCGTVCLPREPRFADCRVVGAYRLRIDPSANGLSAQRVVGTVEAVLVRPC